ncbi:dehydrogenase [Lithospermum erythrorhizon]|uniref:Dehydrogenase n=1 Tax=Lithospermum erythrorhizon TaxID=34254 RepID=A0AAV3PEI7_LITER
MAMKRAAVTAIRAFATPSRHFHSGIGSKKIVGVFYNGNEYAAKNPNFVGCVENALGIREWLESQGHQYIVTADKEGPRCGKRYCNLCCSKLVILHININMS